MKEYYDYYKHSAFAIKYEDVSSRLVKSEL